VLRIRLRVSDRLHEESKEDDVSRECGMCGRHEKCTQGFMQDTWSEETRDHLAHLGIKGEILLKQILNVIRACVVDLSCSEQSPVADL
jgi:hypothetical protein